MYTYDSFLNTKKHSLNENQLKIDQEGAVSRAIKYEEIILTDDINDSRNSWAWNEKTGAVDFDCNVRIDDDLQIKSLKDLGFKFGRVKGDFDCSGLEIVNLEGSPKTCRGFNAGNSNLKSLIGSPYMVENFEVNNCLIGSLEGSPRFVFGDFNLSNNMITDISEGPFLISGSINLMGNGFPHNFKLFRDMHKFIAREYMNINFKSAMDLVSAEVSNKEYFINILIENIGYVQFFKEYYNADLAHAIIKLKPSPEVLNSIRNNLPLVWEEITKIYGEDSGYKTAADLGELGF
jgi:hypothetical protein